MKHVTGFYWQRITQLISAIVLITGIWLTPAIAEDRIALVVGNSSYTSISALDNPSRDAELIATTLDDIGFQVTLLLDANQTELRRALSLFGRRLRNGDADTTGLFYYAGHGVQSFGNNYLLPVDVELTDAADLDLMAVEAQSVLRQMASARNQTNIVILDACRNNPFEDAPEFDKSGLAEMQAPTGTFLSYATAPGSVALDGIGENSPFTRALAEEMVKPGAALEIVFKQVRVSVLETTKGQQTPWDTSSLTSDFQFVAAPIEDADALAARQIWEMVKSMQDRSKIEFFLQTFPDSVYAQEARALLEDPADSDAQNEPSETANSDQSLDTESNMFQVVQADPSVNAYKTFLVAFPDGVFSDLAKQELAALQNGTSTDPVGTGVTPPQPETTQDVAQLRGDVPPLVLYDAPIKAPGTPIDGMWLSDVFKSHPIYPPIPDLPDEYWKGETCSGCHQWSRNDLCEKSNAYLNLSGQKSLEKDHPFGGALKQNLRNWAIGGCR